MESGNGTSFSSAMTNGLKQMKMDKYVSGNAVLGESKDSTNLDKQDYQYLSNKWNPTEMTQENYDEFLDYLQDKGIISETDKEYLDYGGETRIWPDELATVTYYPPDVTPVYGCGDGNWLSYVRFQGAIVYEPKSEHMERKVDLFKKITVIMEKIAQEREEQ